MAPRGMTRSPALSGNEFPGGAAETHSSSHLDSSPEVDEGGFSATGHISRSFAMNKVGLHQRSRSRRASSSVYSTKAISSDEKDDDLSNRVVVPSSGSDTRATAVTSLHGSLSQRSESVDADTSTPHTATITAGVNYVPSRSRRSERTTGPSSTPTTTTATRRRDS
jgi:hypothetical protein